MKRQATYIRLHSNVYSPAVGELGNVFPHPTKTLENLVMMDYGADGVIVEFMYRGLKKELHFPAAACAVIDLVPEEKPSLKSVKSSA